jgi:hypothetical protein
MGIEASILRQPPPCSANYLFASWFKPYAKENFHE